MQYISGTNIPTPTARTPFSEVLPYNQVFQPELLNQLSYSQVAPDVLRSRNEALNYLGRNLASTGAYRTGLASKQVGDVYDAAQRQIAEGQSEFTGNINDWLNTWYNRQAQAYYTNPTAWQQPTLPTFDEYMKANNLSTLNPGGQQLTGLENQGWNPSFINR